MKYFPAILIWFVVSVLSGQAQPAISGQVYGGDDNAPLPGAHIYLANTTIGTSSLADGRFELNNLPPGKQLIAVSYLGYETLTFEVLAGSTVNYKIVLKPDRKRLGGVTIQSRRRNKAGYLNNLAIFTAYFIGRGSNASHCKILNPEVIRFENGQNDLKAFASEPIRIENRALGYAIEYSLAYFNFNLSSYRINYDGYPLFLELEPADQKEKERWEAARLESYKGSMMHFMRSFYQQTLLENGFVLRDVEEEVNFKGQSTLVAAVGDTLVNFYSVFGKKYPSYYTQHYKSIMDTVNSTPDYPLLAFKNRLEIKYLGESETYEYQKLHRDPSERGLLRPQTSFMQLLAPSVGVQEDGQFFDAKDIFCEGYWTWELMADALPIDYVPTKPFENIAQ